MNFLIAIAGLAFLILVHEAGHFYVARAVGMRPRRFYVGFPPALAKYTRNGIEYGIGSIPLGGYVKIPGMHRPAPSDLDLYFGPAMQEAPELLRWVTRVNRPLADGDMEAARAALRELEAPLAAAPLSPGARRSAERGLRELGDGLGMDAYWRQRTWKRLAVIAAGPGTNLVLAVALLAIVYVVGVPVIDSWRVERVVPGTPAASAGLQPGDEIIAVNNKPTPTYEEVSRSIRASEGRPIAVSVRRDGRRVDLPPRATQKVDDRYQFGFAASAEFGFRRYGVLASIERATGDTWEVTKAIGASLARIARGSGREEVASPVGIVTESSKAVEAGFRYYVQILALISLSLALLNLLPLLPLDGGHIAFSLIEGVRGRAVGRGVYERVSVVGIALVLLLFVVGLTNDIGRLSD